MAARMIARTMLGASRTVAVPRVAARTLSTAIIYPPSTAKVTQPAPQFTAGAVVNETITKISLSDYKGKWVVFFFYPKDFTFVCPTEIIAFSERAKDFEAVNAQLIAASTDTVNSHLAWVQTPRKQGGLGQINIPIIEDPTRTIANQYGVLVEAAGIALRGLFLINPEGVIEHITINNFPVGRSVDEALRLVEAFQFVRKHGEVCPANWNKTNNATIVPTPTGSLKYFEKANN